MAWSPDQQQAWLDQVNEDIIDPDRPIVDPHHHMWRESGLPTYLLDNLWQDTGSGHNIVKTVFMECGAEYHKEGPEHLRVVGETEFVAAAAIKSRGSGKAEISGIVAHTDLMADAGVVDEVLAAHVAASDGLFRGIRHGGAHDPYKALKWGDATDIPDLYLQPAFQAGVRQLGAAGYTYDTWHYHFQNRDYLALAQAAPDTVMVLDHFGSPVGVGPFEGRMSEVFQTWKEDIAAIAQCDNVVVKIGGLAMPVNGFDWHKRDTPASSDELVAAQREFYLHTIDCFGPDRCMLESNFPVDKMSISYAVYWNAMKKLSAKFSESDKDLMFRGTASRVYGLTD